jgi:hypothetical protein
MPDLSDYGALAGKYPDRLSALFAADRENRKAPVIDLVDPGHRRCCKNGSSASAWEKA